MVCLLIQGAYRSGVIGCFSGLLVELGDLYVGSPMCTTNQPIHWQVCLGSITKDDEGDAYCGERLGFNLRVGLAKYKLWFKLGHWLVL